MKKIKGAAKPTSDNSHPEILGSVGWLDPNTPARLLEVGCGGGHFLAHAARLGLEVYAIDADMRMVLAARERCEGIDSVGLRILHHLIGKPLPALWPSFDYVVAFESIEHTENPVDAFRWIHDVLGPGGYVIGSVPNDGRGRLAEGILRTAFPETDDDVVEINRHKSRFDVETLETALEMALFEDVETIETTKGSKHRILYRGRRAQI
jgi:SAM-dependent methyltransferase